MTRSLVILSSDFIEGGAGGDALSGGGQIDTLSYETSDAAVTVNLFTNVVSGGHAQGDTISGFENVLGSGFADTITGSSAGNVLQGGADVDTIDGGAGSDLVEGGSGADILTGGTNSFAGDTLSYAGSSAGVSINLLLGLASGGDAAGDTFSGFENVLGSAFSDSLTGNSGNNTLTGGAGAGDNFRGLGGDDLLVATANGAVDRFTYFNESNGVDRIQGFDTTQDLIRYEATLGAFSAVQEGLNTRITFANALVGESILLVGVTAATIDGSDFEIF